LFNKFFCCPALLLHGFLLSVLVEHPHGVLVLMHRIFAEYVAVMVAKVNHKAVFLALFAVRAAEDVLMMAV